MEETIYSVSQAVKFLEVQSHVLRYWEEELGLPIRGMRWDTDTTPDGIFRYS